MPAVSVPRRVRTGSFQVNPVTAIFASLSREALPPTVGKVLARLARSGPTDGWAILPIAILPPPGRFGNVHQPERRSSDHA